MENKPIHNATSTAAIIPFKTPTIALPGSNKKERVSNAIAAEAQALALKLLCESVGDAVKATKDLLIDPSSKIRLGAAALILGKIIPDKLSVQGDALDQLDDKDLLDIVNGKRTLSDILSGKSGDGKTDNAHNN